MKCNFLILCLLSCLLASSNSFADKLKCPDNLTKLEEDGIYSVLPAGEERFKQLSDCERGEVQMSLWKLG